MELRVTKYDGLYLESSNELLVISDLNLWSCSMPDFHGDEVKYKWNQLTDISKDIDVTSMEICYQGFISIFKGKYIMLFIADEDYHHDCAYAHSWLLRMRDKKWISCDNVAKVPRSYHCDIVKHKNIVHFIDCSWGSGFHFALNLDKIIPKKIFEEHVQEMQTLMTGFIRTEIGIGNCFNFECILRRSILRPEIIILALNRDDNQ